MKKQFAYHAIIACGLICTGLAFWFFLAPADDRPLTVAELRKLLIHGNTPQERALGAAGLGERGDVPSMPLLLAAMEDENVVVRARAGVAVSKILGADFFFRADDPPEQRAQSITKYKNLWEAWQTKTNYAGDIVSADEIDQGERP